MNENEKITSPEVPEQNADNNNAQEVNGQSEQIAETPAAEKAPEVKNETETPEAGTEKAAEEPQPEVKEEPEAKEEPEVKEQPEAKEEPEAKETPAEAEVKVEVKEEEAEKTPVNYAAMTKEELVGALKAVLDENRLQAHKEVSLMKQALFNIRQKEIDAELEKFLDAGNEPAAFSAIPCEIEAEFKTLHNEFKERRAAFLEEEDNRRQENLAKKLGVIDRIKALMEDVDNINRNYQNFVELQTEFKEIKDIPAQAENDVWKQYQAQVEQFYDLLKMNKDLRDLDFKKNLEVKKQLIEQARQLAEEEDVIEAARKLQILHNEWRETGPVAKDLREEIWAEFKDASTVVNKRHQEYFDKRRENELKYEEEKTKICEQVEALDFENLKTFSAWEKTTDEIKAFQAQWKELGPAPRKVNSALYARFRAVCDDFFNRKAEFYHNIKAEYKTNLEKKEDLCRRAEEMLSKIDEKGSREAVQALQKEWKTVGPTERRHSDAVWQRFTAACNAFYEELRSRRSGKREEENANLAAKKEIIEKIKEIPLDGNRGEILPAIRELQMQWQQIGYVPYKNKEKIYAEYREACDKVYDSLDNSRTRQRMNDYQERIRGLRGDRGGMMTEREKLNMALDRKKNDLATYENNMGFFNVKSSAGNAMVLELERKIKKIKEEIEEIKNKIKLLDTAKEENKSQDSEN